MRDEKSYMGLDKTMYMFTETEMLAKYIHITDKETGTHTYLYILVSHSASATVTHSYGHITHTHTHTKAFHIVGTIRLLLTVYR